MMARGTFSGTWKYTCWYPTHEDSAEGHSEYRMSAHDKGHEVVFESEPRDDGSYMLACLKVDDNVATGSWHETTKPHGTFEGMTYSGAGQMLVSENGRHMVGKWAGVGMEPGTGTQSVYRPLGA